MKTLASILITLLLATASGNAQDYNFSFETWLDHGAFEEPEYWGTFNPVAIVGIQAHKDTDAMHGNYSLKLASQNIPAGVAILGTINASSGLIKPGRPYAHRPEKVSCWYKTKLVNGDSSAIVFNLTKYDPLFDSTIQVGFAGRIFYNDVTEWTLLELDFEYYTEDMPDTLGVILASTSNPDGFGNPGCELSVDGIEFTFPTAVESVKPTLNSFSFYPNPATDVLTIINNDGIVNKNHKICITDIDGRVVLTALLTAQRQTVFISSLPKGMYSIHVVNEGNTKMIGNFMKE